MERGNPGYNHYNEGRMAVAESFVAYGIDASEVVTYTVKSESYGYQITVVLKIVTNDENSEAVRQGKVIVNCPYRERELVEAFIRGLECGRLYGGFDNSVERGAKAIALGRGINLSRYLLNTDFVVRWRDSEGAMQEKEMEIK